MFFKNVYSDWVSERDAEEQVHICNVTTFWNKVFFPSSSPPLVPRRNRRNHQFERERIAEMKCGTTLFAAPRQECGFRSLFLDECYSHFPAAKNTSVKSTGRRVECVKREITAHCCSGRGDWKSIIISNHNPIQCSRTHGDHCLATLLSAIRFMFGRRREHFETSALEQWIEWWIRWHFKVPTTNTKTHYRLFLLAEENRSARSQSRRLNERT